MKKLLIFIAVPVFVVIAAILALVLLVNPNQFKPLIVEQAQKHTGLELVIEVISAGNSSHLLALNLVKLNYVTQKGSPNRTYSRLIPLALMFRLLRYLAIN